MDLEVERVDGEVQDEEGNASRVPRGTSQRLASSASRRPGFTTCRGHASRAARWLTAAVGAVACVGIAGLERWLPGSIIPSLLCVPVVVASALWGGMRAAMIVAVVVSGASLFVRVAETAVVRAPGALETGFQFGVLAGLAVTVGRLASSARDAREQAGRDSLTGLLNGTTFGERAEAELNRCRRNGRPITLAFIDGDRFKEINDTHGHTTGDRALQAVADVLRSHTRSYDIVARFGGDEFVMLLPETGPRQARRVLERLRDRLREAMRAGGVSESGSHQAEPPALTFSIGVATFLEPPQSVDALLHRADEQMYAVKASGRDGIAFWESSADASRSPGERPA